jgi:hypothetical protein
MSNATIDHIDEVLAYFNENGESETLQHFGITAETLRRYERKKNFWQTKQPKVGILDIETSPLQVNVWGTWKQRIGHEQVINDWYMLSYSWKWLFDSKVSGSVLTPTEAINRDDSRICREVWKFLDQCDVVIGHNINRFDIPKVQTRFIVNKLAPPSPFRTIDTLTIAQQNFRFASNKLDYIGDLLLHDRKIHTEYQLWLDCMKGVPEALSRMLTYNKKDVLLEEEAYVFLRPWIKSHPNMAIYQESIEPSCPTCGSTNIDECGYYSTSVNRYLAFRCKDCGAICRSRKVDTPLKCKSGIMMPTAR